MLCSAHPSAANGSESNALPRRSFLIVFGEGFRTSALANLVLVGRWEVPERRCSDPSRPRNRGPASQKPRSALESNERGIGSSVREQGQAATCAASVGIPAQCPRARRITRSEEAARDLTCDQHRGIASCRDSALRELRFAQSCASTGTARQSFRDVSQVSDGTKRHR